MTAHIIGSGMFVPDGVVTNDDLAEKLGIDSDQIFKSSGIRSRRWVSKGTTTSSLAVNALDLALADAGLSAHDIDYLLMGTMTPDRFIPGCAPAVQEQAGLGHIPCLDIRAACCNAIYAMQLAKALILSGTAINVAICLAEIQSAWLNLSAEAGTTSMLFGDGASALIISSEPRAGALEIIDVLIGTDGSNTDALGIRRPGTEYGPFFDDAPDLTDHKPRMAGPTVIRHSSRNMIAACIDLVTRNALTIDDIAWLVPHQANSNLLLQVARGLGFPETFAGVISVIEEYGNTSSASMGLALDHLRRPNRVKKGDHILMPAFGAGFTWGAALCKG